MISYYPIINGQHLISGTILDKSSKEPLPGAVVSEKGISTETITDFDGNFELLVQSTETVLAIQYVGFSSEEVKINGKTEIVVLLAENCVKCWFDSQEVNIAIYSGLLETPFGLKLDISSPVLFREPVLRLSGRLQTDLNRSNYLNLGASLNHLLSSCQFDADISFQFNRFKIENLQHLTDYSAALNLNWNNKINPIVGVKYFSYPNNDVQSIDNNILYGIGFNSNTYLPILLEISSIIFFNNKQINYTAKARSYYRGLNIFLEFYKFEAISEFSIGLGYELGYSLKRQRDMK